MNWLDREILGLRRQDKIGAPKYYDDTGDLIHSLIGVTIITFAQTYKNIKDRERMRKLQEDADRARDENKNDRIDPTSKPEKPEPSKPVEQTPADPKPDPVQPKVNPTDVSPRADVPGQRER